MHGGEFHKGRMAQVSITDTGPGIPPEEAGKIFDEFYQMGQPGPEKRLREWGLGLAI